MLEDIKGDHWTIYNSNEKEARIGKPEVNKYTDSYSRLQALLSKIENEK